jgi:cytochrome P450
VTDDLELDVVAAIGDVRDPYPDFARKRRETPVEFARGFNGEAMCHVYAYADVAHALREADVFSSRVYAPAIGMVFGPSILQMDGVPHQRHRSLIGGAFRRSILTKWETELVVPTVHQLIDRFAARGSAELVRELTLQYPIKIISRILGIPADEHMRFARLSLDLIGIAFDPERGMRASAELKEYFARALAERRAEPQDDLISMLAHTEIDGHTLPDEEIFGFLRLLLPAGAETTYRLLGSLLLALLWHPEQLDEVRADRALVAPAIEEALRWEAPVQVVSREPLTDTELGGVKIEAGTHVSLKIGSANHDETVFDDPDSFDVHRASEHPHIAFAEGPHRCLGEHLARLETTVALNAVLDRLGDIRLDAEGGEAYVQGIPFRSPNRIPVRFAAS